MGKNTHRNKRDKEGRHDIRECIEVPDVQLECAPPCAVPRFPECSQVVIPGEVANYAFDVLSFLDSGRTSLSALLEQGVVIQEEDSDE